MKYFGTDRFPPTWPFEWPFVVGKAAGGDDDAELLISQQGNLLPWEDLDATNSNGLFCSLKN